MKDVAICDKLRGGDKQPLIRRSPNGETQSSKPRLSLPEYIGQLKKTWGSETSQYPEEYKVNNDSLSSGERKGNSLNHHDYTFCEVFLFGEELIDLFTAIGPMSDWGSGIIMSKYLYTQGSSFNIQLKGLESSTIEGESPVNKKY